ncbi:hypothetical protein CJU77_01210 [Pseudomonas fragi]|nr:hypothetical protein CJU77_01210 [Pseudomonas fragi]
MFRTTRGDLQGGPDEQLLHWKTVDLSFSTYSFFVEGVSSINGKIGPCRKLVSDEETLLELWLGESDFLVNQVSLISPPWMNHQGQYLMEPLTKIILRNTERAPPLYEFVTETGRIYTSVQAS